MPISVDTVRVGKRYVLINYGEEHTFDVIKAEGKNDFLCKDVLSLEHFLLHELTLYGKGPDYDFYALNV